MEKRKSISFLWQVVHAILNKKNKSDIKLIQTLWLEQRNLFFHSSGRWKYKINITRPKSGCWQGCALSCVVGENLFPAVSITGIPWPVVTSL
jgi:hypothetical protein